jgi:Holliday junction resolvase RusA-like endonuclease
MSKIIAEFTIPLPPRTKKNSQRLVVINGRPRILPSKLYKEYEANCLPFMPHVKGLNRPLNVQAVYYMPTRRKVDLCNLHEALCDILVHYNVVDDDNSSIIATMDGSRVEYDKENPRTEVIIREV